MDLRAKLVKNAETDGRTISNLIIKILTDWLGRRPIYQAKLKRKAKLVSGKKQETIHKGASY